MSHVVVFNASAKTVKIPTTPTKYLTEVRDEACQKFNVSRDQFTLKYNNKPISLSQQIRLANLAQGARLELVQASRSPSVISVALQLPASEKNTRLTQKFASNTSLWEILRHFESGQETKHNFTQRGVPEMGANGTSGAGRLNYEMPVITVMPSHMEQSTFVGLQKTLGQLGFDSGTALLRLSYKNSGTPLEEAMAQISQYFQSSDSVSSSAHAASSEQAGTIPDPDQAAPEASQTVAGETISTDPDPEPMDVEPSPAPEITEPSSNSQPNQDLNSQPPVASTAPEEPPTSNGSSDSPGLNRPVQIFSAPTSSTPQAARQAFNQEDYVPTIEHAKSHQASLQTRTKNQRLLSDKELEQQEAERLEKLNANAEKGSSLRIRMPDNSMLQTDISKHDTATFLYDFVKSFLDKKNEPFQLKYTGSNGRLVLIELDDKRLIPDLRFARSEVVTFVWDDAASAEARTSRRTLAPEWQDKAQNLKVDEPVAVAKGQDENVNAVGKAEGKRKAGVSAEEKESKLKNMLNKGLFKRK